jgi:lipoprotein-anchoring transpeptidase ErfK/SrfK
MHKAAIGLAAVTAVAGAIIVATLIRASAAEEQAGGIATVSTSTETTVSDDTTSPVTTTTTAPTTTPPRSVAANTAAPTTTTTTRTTTRTTTTKKQPPKTTPAKPKPAVGAPCNASARACIDLSANRSWLLDGAGNVVYGPVPVTHGRAGWRTPAGTFRVTFKDVDHKSSLFDNAPMPYSVFFNGGIAFHAGSLREQSHGCIHLSNVAARMYYNTLKVGDVVQVVP